MKILLVLAYLSPSGIPRMETHLRDDMGACRKEATAYFNQVRAGSARAWCARVFDKPTFIAAG